MSQSKVTLRPPPNVEFVEGYPGIPAGRNRPHAEVRGTIEVRLPAQGAKAKWLHVQLTKIETLPAGGGSYSDHIGQSPVKLWDADGEWSVLYGGDFPFAIRIPESVPPTITLDRGAGIKYVLNATLCLKGKKGFFFKKKDPLLTSDHPIIIDKHELHSTWPVYAQPESRHVVEDLLVLTVDRTHTCYGPGDMVKVVAAFKNDGIPAAALRSFEFLLKETIIYRSSPNNSGKKRAPQVNVTPIGEYKMQVNMTVYQGQSHKAELGCFIPQTHTNTTVVAARHIDISYKIEVKAILGTGKPLIMELPVTVSNWPKNMSVEAVRRIGPAPNLSLSAPINITAPATIGTTRPTIPAQQSQQSVSNTLPARSGLFPDQPSDRMASQAMSSTSSAYGDPVTGPRSNYDEFGLAAAAAAGLSYSAVPRGASPAIGAEFNSTTRRNPAVNTNSNRRLTLTNAEPELDIDSPLPNQPSSPRKNVLTLDEGRRGAAGSSAPGSDRPIPPRINTGSSQRSAWPTAEEEKQRLFNQARAQALKTQASMGNKLVTMPEVAEAPVVQSSPSTSPSAAASDPAPAVVKLTEPKKNTPWPTAEEEKMRLYQEAEKARLRAQAQVFSEGYFPEGSRANGGSPPPVKTSYSDGHASSGHRPNPSSSSITNDVSYKTIQPIETKSTGAQLYQHAIASMNRKPSLQAPPLTPPSPPAPRQTNAATSQRSYPTAEEEKAALRYYEAKRAVDRHQQVVVMDQIPMASSPAPGEGPIAYEDLYPAGVSSARAGGSSHVANGVGRRVSEASNGDVAPPPPISPPTASLYESAMSEKERLRRKYEAEDTAATTATVNPAPPTPPTRGASANRDGPPGYSPPPTGSRSQPLPPVDYSGPKMLTAAEEKARLRAKMEAEDAAAAGVVVSNGNNAVAGPSSGIPSASLSRSVSMATSYARHEPLKEEMDAPPPLPPPLAPRPPAEYIEQTKEEDLLSQAEHHALPAAAENEPLTAGVTTTAAAGAAASSSRLDFGLPFRPFSPFDLNVNFDSRAPSVMPPPLPPKVPVSQ